MSEQRARPNVPCTRCDGSGCVPISDELWKVLQVVRRGPVTAPELDARLGYKNSSPTAMNNLLEDLRAFGLVDRMKRGGIKTWVYFAPEEVGRG